MKHTTFVVLLVITILFSSCLRKTSNENQSRILEVHSEKENNSESEKIRDIIQIFDNTIKVLDLVKIDFGVPDCENWLVAFQSYRFDGTLMENISLFRIKNDKIIKEYFLGINYDFQEYSQYDIMKDIPGTRMGSGASAYGDYNGDGVMDLFRYAFGGNGWFVNILGYDAETDEIISYCDEPGIPFGIIDTVNGPAPTEFMTYNGRYGFKVYIEAVTVAGGPDYVPEPMPYNNKWFFYSWDETQKMYIEIGEVKD